MLTLTYHEGFPDYKKSKQHLNTFLRNLNRDGVKYLWVVEFQARGFPHYHVWIDRELPGEQWRRYMKTWLTVTSQYNGNPSAVAFHLHDRVYCPWNVELNLNYAAKYSSKQRQKHLPAGVETFGRWWGTSRIAPVPEYSIAIDITDNQNITDDTKEIITYHMTQFRRNVKRAIFAWSKRRKRNRFDRKTNCGFTYILSAQRKQCIKRLLTDAINSFEEDSGHRLRVVPPAEAVARVQAMVL
jgi:hypothetical protein